MNFVPFALQGDSPIEGLYEPRTTALRLQEDVMVAAALPGGPVTLGKFSSLSFCFRSDNANSGKTHAIGVTDDPSTTRFGPWFDVFGTNVAWAKSVSEYRYLFEQMPTRWQCFDVPLSDYYYDDDDYYYYNETSHPKSTHNRNKSFLEYTVPERTKVSFVLSDDAVGLEPFLYRQET